MAEHLFNRRSDPDTHHADSAGLAAWTGEPISDHARDVLRDTYGIDAGGHRARRLHENHVEQADLVLTMNARQRDHLRHLLPECAGKIQTIGEAAGEPYVEVGDPFGQDLDAYQITARQLEHLIQRILPTLTRESSADKPE
jgi:protein-tyrosine-phosphatase